MNEDTLTLKDGTTLYAYWVCVDCYFAHHYGARSEHVLDDDGCWEARKAQGNLGAHAAECFAWYAGDSDEPADREPLGIMPEGAEIADWTDAETEEGIDPFSWSRCEGCGSSLGGARYRLSSTK